MICDHNCFECPFPDCIAPDDDISPLEEQDARKRDAELTRSLCPADLDDLEQQRKKIKADADRRYVAQNREKVRAGKAACRAKRRDYYKKQSLDYYYSKRDEINAARREAYRRKKALERLLDGKETRKE
jgi:hypothetical protein